MWIVDVSLLFALCTMHHLVGPPETLGFGFVRKKTAHAREINDKRREELSARPPFSLWMAGYKGIKHRPRMIRMPLSYSMLVTYQHYDRACRRVASCS